MHSYRYICPSIHLILPTIYLSSIIHLSTHLSILSCICPSHTYQCTSRFAPMSNGQSMQQLLCLSSNMDLTFPFSNCLLSFYSSICTVSTLSSVYPCVYQFIHWICVSKLDLFIFTSAPCDVRGKSLLGKNSSNVLTLHVRKRQLDGHEWLQSV